MDFLKKYNVILASKSPRRKQLLQEMGVDFIIKTKHVEESFPENLPKEQVARYLSEKKAAAFAKSEISENDLVITADTIVCLGSTILNKPGGRDHAIEMLTLLSGKKHEVITGVSFRTKSRLHSFYVSTDVYFKKLSKGEIEYYVEHFKPFDKAGSYGIQEWIGYVGIQKIEGSYFNVVGLPTARLYDELKQFLI